MLRCSKSRAVAGRASASLQWRPSCANAARKRQRFRPVWTTLGVTRSHGTLFSSITCSVQTLIGSALSGQFLVPTKLSSWSFLSPYAPGTCPAASLWAHWKAARDTQLPPKGLCELSAAATQTTHTTVKAWPNTNPAFAPDRSELLHMEIGVVELPPLVERPVQNQRQYLHSLNGYRKADLPQSRSEEFRQTPP